MKIVLILLAILAVPWKIYAVWLACKHNHKKWFVALVLLNTLAVLEIFYIFYILKKRWSDVKHDFIKGWTIFKEEISFKKKS